MRFRLKTLLLLVTLGCLYVGMETTRVRSGLRQVQLAKYVREDVGPPVRTAYRKRWSIISFFLTGDFMYSFPIGVEIYGGQATDESIPLLQELSSLRKLKISGVHVTDAGISNLTHLINLRDLDVTETSISPSGIERIQRALPKCQIRRWNSSL